MQRLLIVGLIAIVLFAASAATSLYLRQSSNSPEESPTAKKTSSGTSAAEDTQGTPSASPVKPAVRPPFNPQSDTTVQIAANLNKQTETLRARELALATRQKTLDLAYQDIRNERLVVDELRKKLTLELSAIEAKTTVVENKVGEMEKERLRLSKEGRDLSDQRTVFEKGEQEQIKHMAGIYDAMAPASAAKLLEQMSNSGKLDTAVKVLAAMKERQAAKVIAEATDAAISGQWMEKLKNLRQPAPPAPKK